MNQNETAIETMLQAKGKTAPRITPDQIQATIKTAHYFTAEDGVTRNMDYHPLKGELPESLGLLTFCVLVLQNGFTVTGESACASPENFDAEIGRKIARQNAEAKIWALEGYLLKQQLHKLAMFEAAKAEDVGAQPPHQQRVIDEKRELDDKIEKLSAFFGTPLFGKLDAAEQQRLNAQGLAMTTYSVILDERIAAFTA